MTFPPPNPRPARCAARFRPRVEGLEARTVPACSNLTSTTLSASVNPAVAGQPVTFTAIVNVNSLPFPTGHVIFVDGANLLGWGQLAGLQAKLTTALAAGVHSVRASYLGDGMACPSDSALLVEMVNLPPLPPPPLALDVSAQVVVVRGKPHADPGTGRVRQRLTLRNVGGLAVAGPLWVVLDGLGPKVRLRGPAGSTQAHPPLGSPYVYVNLFQLAPGESFILPLQFRDPLHMPVHYHPRVLAGPGAV